MGDNRTPTGGFQMDVDIDTPVAPAPSAPSEAVQQFTGLLPEGFADKPWVQELAKTANPLQELFNQHENQMSLIGRKAEGLRVPAADAPDTEREAFYKAIGVPDKPEDYVYVEPKVPEHLKEFFAQDTELLTALRAAAKKGGVTPQGFNGLAAAFDDYYLQKLDQNIAAAKEVSRKAEFAFKGKYGDRSNQILDKWNKEAATAPEWAAPILDSVPDIAKLAMAAHFDGWSGKYIKEDGIDLKVPASGHGLSQTEYGNEFAQAFAALRSAKPGSAEALKAQSAYDALRAKGAEQVFKP